MDNKYTEISEAQRGRAKSFTIIVATDTVDVERLCRLVCDAANRLAAAIDDGVSQFDVDVIEGTYNNPLSGDNVHGLGRSYG